MIGTKLFDQEGRQIFLGDIVDPQTGMSGAMKAAKIGDLEKLRFLRDRHANFDLQDHDGWTALFYAAACHNVECVRFLVKAGVDLEVKANDWWTALMVAIDHQQGEIVDILCEAGAKIGSWNRDGSCELVIAMRNPEIVEKLLQYGADPELPHPRIPFMKPLMASMGHRETDARSVKILVRYGAVVDSVNDAGQTSLMLSVANADVMRALLECGADMSIKDCDGETVFDYVMKNGADTRAKSVLEAWVE